MSPATGATTAGRPTAGGTRPGRRLFRRRKFDPQPQQHASVLVVLVGERLPDGVVARALELSGGEPVAVAALARIYGSPYGLPNPGLLPTKKELAERFALVNTVIAGVERGGSEGLGQVAATRRPIKTIIKVVQARTPAHVLIVTPAQPRWRRLVEGDLSRDVRRRVPEGVIVEGFSV